MKCGILTFHDGLNHGAYLQAYSTLNTLRNEGHDVFIINYKNRRHYFIEDILPWFKYRRPSRFIDAYKKRKSFLRDQRQFPLTPFTTDPNRIREKLDFDSIVVGSDVVWDYRLFGFDSLYFGSLPANKKIAFAPSFGGVNAIDPIPGYIRQALENFDEISVRDENSASIVRQALKIDPKIVLDPVFICDFSEQSKLPPRTSPYLLLYAYTVPEEIKTLIDRYAESKGLKIVVLGYRQRGFNNLRMDVGPLEWLSYFKHADSVVTSTFHGVAFSLKFQKTFHYLSNTKAHNRVTSLLKTSGVDSNASSLKNGEFKFYDPVYQEVTPRLDALAEESRSWLLDAVSH